MPEDRLEYIANANLLTLVSIITEVPVELIDALHCRKRARLHLEAGHVPLYCSHHNKASPT